MKIRGDFFTSIDQSKHLLDLGLNPETADMCWGIDGDTMKYNNNPYPLPWKDYTAKDFYLPCWSLAALMDVMPSGCNLSTPKPMNTLPYCCWNQDTEFYGRTSIGAAIAMINWLIENNKMCEETRAKGEQKTNDKVEPKFKIGDRIVEKELDECGSGTIVNIKDGKYFFDDGCFIRITEQERWQLVEQKPIDKVEPKFKVGDCIYDKRDSYNRNVIREVGKDYYINAFAQKMDMAYTNANFEFLKHLEDDHIDSKPAAWSEEDGKIRKEIISFLKEGNPYYCPNSVRRHEWAAWVEKQGNLVKYYEDKLDRCACNNFNKGYKKALEKQGGQEQLYIRFGEIPTDEKSKIYQGEIEVGTENGVSVYPAFRTDEGNIVLGLSLPITKTTLYTQQHLIEYDDRPCYLVKGDYVGKDTDGQPLINNVSIIKKIDNYRVKEEKQCEQKLITFNDAHIIDSALNDYCCKQYSALYKENGGVLSFARLQHLAMDIYGWCKNQGEQKPTDKIEPKFKVGDKIKLAKEPNYPAREIIAIKNDAYYFDTLVHLPFSHQDEWELVGQKPTDKVEPKFHKGDIIKPKGGSHTHWEIMQVNMFDKKYRFKNGCVIPFSQEDAYELVGQNSTDKVEPKFKVGDHISNGISEVKIVKVNDNSYSVTNDEIENDSNPANWVVYFKDQDNWKLFEQNPAWSEEDENRFRNLVYLVEHSNEGKGTKEGFVKFINRLKSLKEKYTWKPSDEQMKALWDSIPENVKEISEREMLLNSLYQDLKKLRGECN